MLTVSAPTVNDVRVLKVSRLGIQPFQFIKECPDDLERVLFLAVNGVIQPAHLGGGDRALQSAERGANLGMLQQQRGADQRHGVVDGKIMAIVLQDDEM